jgi:hypothetical protein
MLCCPVTSHVKGYPFEVTLIGVKGVAGVVLSDQIRSLDWGRELPKRPGEPPMTFWPMYWPSWKSCSPCVESPSPASDATG